MRGWGSSQLCSQPYLEVVEFIITKDLVVILVREVENPCQCSCTCRFQLQGTNHRDKNKATPLAWLCLLKPHVQRGCLPVLAGSTVQLCQYHSSRGSLLLDPSHG